MKKYFNLNVKIKAYTKSIFRYKVLLIAVLFSTVVFFAGCQSKEVDVSGKQGTGTNTVKNASESDTAYNSITERDFNFCDLSKYQFVFSSGAGAWQTMLNINEDGTFQGYFSDSDMGDIGDDYPKGTVYLSEFEGKFTTPEKVNSYTYSVEIEYIKLEKEVDTEEIIDGIKYIYSEPYGLNDAKEIYIYTPEAPIKELPEGFRNWVGYRNLSNVEEEYLPFYGLYNLDADCGFSSYLIDEIEKD